MAENNEEVSKENITPDNNEQQEMPTLQVLPESVPDMTPEERNILMQELQALGSLLGATWNKPVYIGKHSSKPEVSRSIPLNIFSEPMLLRMQKRAEAVMIKLGWFKATK